MLSGASVMFVRGVGGTAPLVPSIRTPGAIRAARTPCSTVSLTFDDGPHPTLTPTALDLLAEFGARATFFVVGTEVDVHPDLVRRAVHDGHEVANHTWSHGDLVARSDHAILREVRYTDAAIRRAGVEPVQQVRPPRGRLDAAAGQVLRSLGLEIVGWSASTDPLLADGVDPVDAARRVVAPMRQGSIVLFHDGGPVGGRSMTALRPLLEELRAKRLRSVPVGELIDSAQRGVCTAPAHPAHPATPDRLLATPPMTQVAALERPSDRTGG